MYQIVVEIKDVYKRQDFLPRDRTGNRRFIPVPVDAELAEVHILDNEEDSRAYICLLYTSYIDSVRITLNLDLTFCQATVKNGGLRKP